MRTKKKTPPRYKNPAFAVALGKHCKELRQKKGYSIDRMYREGDQLSPGAIQRLETGDGDVHVSLLLRYAMVLNVPLLDLFKFKFKPDEN